MGSYPIKLPETSGVVTETLVKASFKESVYNSVTGKYEEVERISTVAEYKGGSLLGWNIYAPEKTKILLYDNIEKAEGTNYGIVSINEKESIRDWFGSNGIKFKNALYCKVIEGKPEGCIFVDIE